MKFPIAPPTDAEALAAYQELIELDPTALIKQGAWFSRSSIPPECVVPMYIDSSRVGMPASDRHHWATRMACDSLNSPSPIRSWYQPKHRATLEGSKFFEENPKTALALRKYIASQFRPSAARAVYAMFQAKSVYDPCGGWGDRMVAAMAAGVNYHCRDTNPLVIAGYASMQHMFSTDASISFEYVGAEVDSPDGEFDLVFTSPPYWKAEKYHGEKSSFRMYKSFDEWLDGFLLNTLDNAWRVLKHGGHLVLNVSDIYANHTYNEIIAPVLTFFGRDSPRVMGYRMAKRVGSKSNADGIFCEPMIVVRKA